MASRKQLQRRARRQGRLRYAPEEQALGLLERDARRDFRDTRAGQRSAADSIVTSAQQGASDIRGIYENAGLTDLVRAGLESNPQARRLAEEMAGAETEMRQREIDAREGEAFAVNQARRDRNRALSDIGRRRTQLAGEKGAFVADLVQQMIGEQQAAQAEAQQHAADQAFDLYKMDRKALLNNDIDPDTGKPLPGAKKDKKKPKPATGADRDASAALGKAKAWIERLDNEKARKDNPDRAKRRAFMKEILTTGDEASGIPALPQHVVEAALDMHFAGRLSPATVKMLRTLGIQVRRLPGVTLGKAPSSRPDTAGNPNVAG